VHAGEQLGRFQPGYHGGGVEATWRAGTWLAPRARVLVRALDPGRPAVTLGAFAWWSRGRWSVTADPYVQLGLANTDRGNRSALWLPVTASVRIARLSLDLRTGWNSDLAVITDGGWHVPGWLGARVAMTPHVELGAALGFYSAAGPQNDGNARALFVTTRWQP
jgi:hypothetical protein